MLNKKLLPAALIVALGVCSPALGAQRFVQIATLTDGVSLIDSDTLEKSGSVISVWTVDLFVRPQRAGAAKPYTKARAFRRFDCLSRTQSLESIVYYDPRGEAVDQDAYPDNWRPIAPESPTETKLRVLCALGAKPTFDGLPSFADSDAAAAALQAGVSLTRR